MTKEKFKTEIQFEPGYDYIYGIPKKDDRYGRHGMQIRFVLKGSKGAVTFLMFTDWLPMVKTDMMWQPTYNMDTPFFGRKPIFPMAADIGYHSPVPLHDYHKKEGPNFKSCPILDGKPCYYDGSSLYAEGFMAELINKGQDALWKKMKRYYKDTFNEKTN